MSAPWATSFWGPGGYQFAVDRVVTGKDNLKCFISILEARAKIETDYAASLEKLSKAHDKEMATASGTIAAALGAVKVDLEEEAGSHRTFALRMMELVTASTTWREEQQKPRKAMIAKGEKAASELGSHTSKMRKAEQKYREVSQKTEAAGLAYQQQQNPKTEKTKVGALKDYHSAEQSYGELVEKVQSLTVALNETYTECFNYFEQSDADRMTHMRDQMLRYSRLTAELAPALERSSQSLSSSFQNISPEADMAAFVAEKQTGNNRPEWLTFEPYNSQWDEQAPTRSYGSPIGPDTPTASSVSYASSSGPASSATATARAPQSSASSSALKAAPSDGFRCEALFEFEAHEKGELPFAEGETLIVTDSSDAGWWLGYAEARPNVKGMFPANYVQKN